MRQRRATRRLRVTAALVVAGLGGGLLPFLATTTASAQTPLTAPGAPTGVTATITGGVATVSWNPPASTGGAPILRYTVLPSQGCPVVVDGSTTTAAVTGLPASGTVTFTVTAATAAGFSAPSAATPAIPSGPKADGYRLVAADGGVFNFGTGPFPGAPTGVVEADVVDSVETPTGNGYWVVAATGAVYAYGDARYLGGANTVRLAAPVVSMSRTADGRGYWLAATDGGVFAYGTARFAGSAATLPLVRPVVAVAGTPSGNGYWLAAADGGVFAYGDARFYGSAASLPIGAPIVDIEATRTGRGYWLVGADGAVFAFGDARYLGGANTTRLAAPIVGITSTGTDRGYVLAAADGGVFAYGDAPFVGSAATIRLSRRVVAVSSVKPVADPAVLQFLQLSDFHGQIEPSGANGGAGVLTTLWKRDRDRVAATFTMNSGDNFGASPAISSFFNEVPTLRAMNIMGYDVNGFGNHEFDKPLATLRNQIALSTAPWVLANHTNVEANLPGVRPYAIVEKGGIRVAFIGINTPETPGLVFPGNLGTMTVTDPTAAVNRYAAEARAAGADVVVVLAHLGVNAGNLGSGAAFTTNPTGALADLARTMTGVDLLYGGHTHQDYLGIINGSLVQQTTNASNRYTRTRMCVDPATRQVTGTAGESVTPTTAGVTPDPAVVALINEYRPQLTALLDPVQGVATALFDRGTTVSVPGGTPAIERAQEVPIGNLVADAMRAKYGTQLALMNGGGLRTQLPAATYVPGGPPTLRRNNQTGFPQGPPFDIVLGDVYALLPFGNLVVTKEITGATLWAALENGVSRWPASDGRFPQISGFRFSFDATRPAGSRVVSVELDTGGGVFTPIPNSLTATYTLATNDFMNQGGDGYTVLNDGRGISRENLAQVTAEYISSLGTITPTTDGRITRIAP